MSDPLAELARLIGRPAPGEAIAERAIVAAERALESGALVARAAVQMGTTAMRALEDRDKLLAAIRRIDAINDNPACFNKEINDVCDKILRPELANG